MRNHSIHFRIDAKRKKVISIESFYFEIMGGKTLYSEIESEDENKTETM